MKSYIFIKLVFICVGIGCCNGALNEKNIGKLDWNIYSIDNSLLDFEVQQYDEHKDSNSVNLNIVTKKNILSFQHAPNWAKPVQFNHEILFDQDHEIMAQNELYYITLTKNESWRTVRIHSKKSGALFSENSFKPFNFYAVSIQAEDLIEVNKGGEQAEKNDFESHHQSDKAFQESFEDESSEFIDENRKEQNERKTKNMAIIKLAFIDENKNLHLYNLMNMADHEIISLSEIKEFVRLSFSKEKLYLLYNEDGGKSLIGIVDILNKNVVTLGKSLITISSNNYANDHSCLESDNGLFCLYTTESISLVRYIHLDGSVEQFKLDYEAQASIIHGKIVFLSCKGVMKNVFMEKKNKLVDITQSIVSALSTKSLSFENIYHLDKQDSNHKSYFTAFIKDQDNTKFSVNLFEIKCGDDEDFALDFVKSYKIILDFEAFFIKVHTFSRNYVFISALDAYKNTRLYAFYKGEAIIKLDSGLANIVDIFSFDIKLAQKSKNIEDKIFFGSNNYFLKLYYRFELQFSEFYNFIIGFKDHLYSTTHLSTNKNLRHTNVLVVTTATGFVYGINAFDGSILWRQHFKINSISKVHIDRDFYIYELKKVFEHHEKHIQSSMAVIVGTMSDCSVKLLVLNPLTGKQIDVENLKMNNGFKIDINGYVHLDSFNCSNPLKVGFSSEKEQILLASSDTKTLNAFPKISFSKKRNSKNELMHAHIRKLQDVFEVVGSEFKGKEMKSVWKIRLPKEAFNVKLVVKSSESHKTTKNQYKLDDKKLHPLDVDNIIIVSYLSNNESSEARLNLLLIDSYTGKMLKSYVRSNIQANFPVNVVYCRNWFIITYTSSKTKLVHITSIAMYTNAGKQETPTFFSSIFQPFSKFGSAFFSDSDQMFNDEIVFIKQTYLLDMSFVDKVTVSKTNFGFAHKSIFFTCPGGRLAFFPYSYIDPRRQFVIDTSSENPEYLTLFKPQLDLLPTSFINYNQSGTEIHAIYSFPTQVESTTVLCFTSTVGFYCSHLVGLTGLPFDMLSHGFDRFIVIALLLCLLVVTVVSYYMSQLKKLRVQWT